MDNNTTANNAAGNISVSEISSGCILPEYPAYVRNENGISDRLTEWQKPSAFRNSVLNTGKLLVACLVFSIVTTALLYDNWGSIMTFVVTCAAVGIGITVLKSLDYKLKPGFVFSVACVLLMALNIGISDAGGVALFDYFGMFMMTLIGLVHQTNQDKYWTFGNYFISANRLFGHSFAHMIDPIADISDRKKGERNGKLKYILIGLGIALAIVPVILVLLSSADAVFGNLTEDILDAVFSTDIIGILFVLLNAFFISYSVCKAVACQKKREEQVKTGSLEPTVAITIGIILSIIYLVFSFIQIAYVFIGNMTLPEGYTYAEYVHQGFNQLVFVCIINLILVFLGRGLFRRNKILNVILTVISGCTLIMVASCAVRIKMYIDVYHMTVLRLLVIWALVIITIAMIGALIYIFRVDFPLFRFCVAAVAVWFICLSFSRPEYCVAKYNLEKAKTCSNVDYEYICSLGRDAAPAIYDAVTNHASELQNFYPNAENDNKNQIDYFCLQNAAKRYFNPGIRYDRNMLGQPEEEPTELPGIRDFNLSLYRYRKLATEYNAG